MNQLKEKIRKKTATIGIIGLGYVGLPLSIAFSKIFNVVGYDINDKIIDNLLRGKSNIMDVSDEEIKKYLNKSFYPTNDYQTLEKCDFIIICVPTPLSENKEPDLSFIKNACRTITKILRKKQIVILESTTYPGTTDEVVVPILEETGLKIIDDFGIAYSPERIDPGNKNFTLEKIPKIVGGINEECTEITAMLYGTIIEKVIKVKNAKTAEAVKMVENIFRNVNIALVNELSLIFEKMGIDSWETIDAASSKPYGFMPFYPGPGIGGHCIPLDPFYLAYKAKKYDFIPRFIETSGEINEFMKIHVVNLVEKGLKKINKSIYKANVTVLGMAYKRNIDDPRESPSIKIIEELVTLGANIRVYDPYIKSINTKVGCFYSDIDIYTALKDADCALFVVDHDIFKELNIYQMKEAMKTYIIIDCKNIFKKPPENCIYLGIGKID